MFRGFGRFVRVCGLISLGDHWITRITRATDSCKRGHVTCPDPTVPLDRTKTSDLPGGHFLMKIHLLMYTAMI